MGSVSRRTRRSGRGVAALAGDRRRVATTTSEGYVEPGVKFSGGGFFRGDRFAKATPGGPFLIEYNRANQPERAKDPEIARKRALERIHPNGAIRVSAVWIAVKDLNTSIEIYKRLGLTPGRAIEVPELSANGQFAKSSPAAAYSCCRLRHSRIATRVLSSIFWPAAVKALWG